MSQFGYTEEQGKNKARADIYAPISTPLISPGIWCPTAFALELCAMSIVKLVSQNFVFLYLQENKPKTGFLKISPMNETTAAGISI